MHKSTKTNSTYYRLNIKIGILMFFNQLQTFCKFYLQKFASYEKILYFCKRFADCMIVLLIQNPDGLQATQKAPKWVNLDVRLN